MKTLSGDLQSQTKSAIMSGFIDNEIENRGGTAWNHKQIRLNCKSETKRERQRERQRWRKNRRKQSSHKETKFYMKSANSTRSPIAPKMRHSESSWDKDTKTDTDTVDDTNVRNSDTYVGCVNQNLQIRILASIFMLVGLVIGWTNSSNSKSSSETG